MIPIRRRCRDQWPHEQQVTEIAEIIAYFLEETMMCDTDKKSKIRSLCGSA
jgi:hypothetical protein